MRIQQQIHSARRRSSRCVAITAQEEQYQQRVVNVVVVAVASVIIALWMAYLPARAGSLLHSLGIVPQQMSAAVDRLHKSDRLARAGGPVFEARWSAVGAIGKPANLSDGRTRIAAAD